MTTTNQASSDRSRFETANRAVKVAGLLSALRSFGEYRDQPVTARELLTWTDTSWTLLAHAARVNPPSATTRSVVVGELAKSEAEADVDPFTRFGYDPSKYQIRSIKTNGAGR